MILTVTQVGSPTDDLATPLMKDSCAVEIADVWHRRALKRHGSR